MLWARGVVEQAQSIVFTKARLVRRNLCSRKNIKNIKSSIVPPQTHQKPPAQYHSPHPVGLGTRPNTSTISIVQCPAVCLDVCDFCDVHNSPPAGIIGIAYPECSAPCLAETSAMSIMRSVPTGMTGIANVWSNFGQFSKTLKNKAFVGTNAPPHPQAKA